MYLWVSKQAIAYLHSWIKLKVGVQLNWRWWLKTNKFLAVGTDRVFRYFSNKPFKLNSIHFEFELKTHNFICWLHSANEFYMKNLLIGSFKAIFEVYSLFEFFMNFSSAQWWLWRGIGNQHSFMSCQSIMYSLAFHPFQINYTEFSLNSFRRMSCYQIYSQWNKIIFEKKVFMMLIATGHWQLDSFMENS